MDSTELLALATELDKEGQYNTAKTLRAAAEALELRASTVLSVPTEPTGQAEALRSIAARLEGSVAAPLSGPLMAAAVAIDAGSVPLDHETPDPHVCRICGEVSLTQFTERCPTCGRWPGAERRHRPIYWLRASNPVEALRRLADTPTVIERILEGGVSDVTGPDGGWTAHETLEHLHNAQTVFRGRIDKFLADPSPELTSVMVWKMEQEDEATEALFGRYRSLRDEIVELLRGIDPAHWWRIGTHEEFGRVTLGEQTSYFANHEPTHLAQIADAAAM